MGQDFFWSTDKLKHSIYLKDFHNISNASPKGGPSWVKYLSGNLLSVPRDNVVTLRPKFDKVNVNSLQNYSYYIYCCWTYCVLKLIYQRWLPRSDFLFGKVTIILTSRYQNSILKTIIIHYSVKTFLKIKNIYQRIVLLIRIQMFTLARTNGLSRNGVLCRINELVPDVKILFKLLLKIRTNSFHLPVTPHFHLLE